MGDITRTCKIIGTVLKFLRNNSGLLIFPFASIFLCSSLAAFFLGYAFDSREMLDDSNRLGDLFFIYYLLACLVIYSSGFGLAYSAGVIFQGQKPCFGEPFRVVWLNSVNILAWTILSSTLGVFLGILNLRLRVFDILSTGFFGVTWGLSKHFTIPVMLSKKRSLLDSMKESQDIFQKTWGSVVKGGYSLNLLFLILGMLGSLLLISRMASGGSSNNLSAAIFLCLVYLIFLATASLSVKIILNQALYFYATFGKAPPGFDPDELRGAWLIPRAEHESKTECKRAS